MKQLRDFHQALLTGNNPCEIANSTRGRLRKADDLHIAPQAVPYDSTVNRQTASGHFSRTQTSSNTNCAYLVAIKKPIA